MMAAKKNPKIHKIAIILIFTENKLIENVDIAIIDTNKTTKRSFVFSSVKVTRESSHKIDFLFFRYSNLMASPTPAGERDEKDMAGIEIKYASLNDVFTSIQFKMINHRNDLDTKNVNIKIISKKIIDKSKL